MTYIEFNDKTLVENLCASLASPPDRVILIGDNKKKISKYIERYTNILRERGVEVEFECRSVTKSNMKDVVSSLSNIVETYDDCVFDLTGGEDIYLVATGIIFERYKDKNIQMHHFNIRNNSIQDFDMDGETILEAELPGLSVEENIRLYGGEIIYDDIRPNTTPLWDFEEGFAFDVDEMWEICRKDVRKWNKQIEVFASAEELRNPDDDELTTTVPMPSLMQSMEYTDKQYIYDKRIINGLYHKGLIDVYADEFTFSIKYRDRQVKKCLTKAGQVLEMKIYVSALQVKDKNNSYTYNDVMNGVYIDWDGDGGADQIDYVTENEIDVLMMHGMVPVFVSCKNGKFENDELHKLNSVASCFGGKYAKKVLIATALDEESDFAKHLRKRATDMHIKIFPEKNGKKIQEMDDDELQKTIRLLWSN